MHIIYRWLHKYSIQYNVTRTNFKFWNMQNDESICFYQFLLNIKKTCNRRMTLCIVQRVYEFSLPHTHFHSIPRLPPWYLLLHLLVYRMQSNFRPENHLHFQPIEALEPTKLPKLINCSNMGSKVKCRRKSTSELLHQFLFITHIFYNKK